MPGHSFIQMSKLPNVKGRICYITSENFSERKLLAEPEIEIASRSVFFDETGKRVRTKKGRTL